MNCFSEVMQCIKKIKIKNTGSITVETAIVFPVVLFFMFLFVSFLQYIAVHFIVSRAANTTAEYMSYYSCIYYEEGIAKIEDSVSKRIYKTLGDDGVFFSKKISELTGEMACSLIAESIFIYELEKGNEYFVGKLFDIKNVSFLGSSFFDTENEFNLHISCTSDLLFPLPFFQGKGYKILLDVPCNGWMRGKIYDRKSENLSVWALDNLSRGRKIENHFGSNLPYNYPTIDIYNKDTGEIVLIQSIDHTTATYMNCENFKKTLHTILLRIQAFDGTYDDPSVDSEYKIKPENIKSRKILLVMPENELTVAQGKALVDFTTQCLNQNVIFEVKSYQLSP